MPNETFESIKHWHSLELDILRRLITRELHRRWDHETETPAQAIQGSGMEPEAEALGSREGCAGSEDTASPAK